MTAALLTLGLGFLYFLAAIPAGTAAGLPLPWAALWAWLGYSAGGAVVVWGGTPLRQWISQRWRLPQRDPKKKIWQVWEKGGLPGLGLLAPVTIGPQAAALLALSVGSHPRRILLWISLGALPWCGAFAVLTHYGIQWVR